MKKILLILLLSFTSFTEEDVEIDKDPFESINRVVFVIFDEIDVAVIKPTAEVYRDYTPKFIKRSISNFFNNLSEIDTIANQLLQAKFDLALQDTVRFLINTTLGVGGIFDLATNAGLERHDEDFGQTLGYWGVNNGPYVFVPFVGPSTLRDMIGYPASWYLSGNFAIDETDMKVVFTTLDVVETRERLLAAENLIVGDKYEFVKDVYMQSRNDLVLDGEVEDEFLIDFETELLKKIS
jgi:Surface lipoprotein